MNKRLKKELNYLGYYLLIGVFYSVFQLFSRLSVLGLPEFQIAFYSFISNMLFYPAIIFFDYFFDLTFRYSVWYIFGIIMIVLYFVHNIIAKYRSPLAVEIKHILVFSIALLIFIVGLAPIFTLDTERVLKDENYQTVLFDAVDRFEMNQSFYYGIDIEGELDAYFVEQDYISNLNNLEYDVLGIIIYNDTNIYIALDEIRNDTKSDGEFFNTLENVFMHEITHYLDATGQLGSETYQCSIYNFNGRDNANAGCTIYNEKFWQKRYAMLNGVNEVEDVEWTLNLKKVFSKGNYVSSDYKNEIVARVNALCLIPDAKNNLNSVKVRDIEFCNQFDFPEEYLKTYDRVLKSFVINYVDTYVYATKTPLIIQK